MFSGLVATENLRNGGRVGELFVILMISSFVFGFAGSFIAKNKGVTQSTGFWLGFFLGPIGLIIVALLNPSSVRRINVSDQFDGDRDLLSDRYQLWLTKKYDIQRNDTLGRYVVGDESFINLEEALKDADRREDIQNEKRQDDADHAATVKKRVGYIAAACLIGAVVIFAGKLVMNYIDHRKAVAAADEAVAMVRSELASVLASAHLPLIQSAKMTQSDYQNDMPTDEVKELGFITSTVEKPTGQLEDSCSIGSGTVQMTDFNGKSVWFSSSDTPEKVRSFYVNELEKAGFTKAAEFHGEDKDRVEYADKTHVVFVNSSLIEGSTNVGICVLGRNEMDKALARKNDYDRKMKDLQAQSEAAQKRLEMQLKENQRLLDSYQ